MPCEIQANREHTTSLSARRLELVEVIRRRVLNEAKTNQWDPSMDPIFARHCSLSTEHQLMDRVLPLVDKPKRKI